MGNERKILDLIFNGAGKAAPELTHDLKAIGNGDMAEGIAQVADFAVRSGFDMGHFSGMKKGISIGLAVGAIGIVASRLWERHNQKVANQAAMWQRFDDDCRTSEKEQYEELKAKEGQGPSEEDTEETVSLG